MLYVGKEALQLHSTSEIGTNDPDLRIAKQGFNTVVGCITSEGKKKD